MRTTEAIAWCRVLWIRSERHWHCSGATMRGMMKRHFSIGVLFVSLVIAFGIGSHLLEKRAAAAAAGAPTAPRFEVDPLWPKPLPNHWILGQTIGVGVDSKDHVFIIHRGDSTLNQRTEAGSAANPPLGECCAAAPPII